MTHPLVDHLASSLVLGALLERLHTSLGAYELLDHWKQGEFHHDVVVRVADTKGLLPGRVLVVATNCNGGVKEVLCFGEVPARGALWRWRCPDSSEFAGDLPDLLAHSTTTHWFDPCELLGSDARSELRPEFRQRQAGGGWQMSSGACGKR